MAETSWLAVPGLLAALSVLAWFAAVLDAAGAAHAEGRPLGPALALVPLSDALRTLHGRRRTTTLPDAPAWRIGTGMLVVVPVLAAAVIPVMPGVAVSDLSTGVVWWTAFMALLWVAVFLVGWSGNSPYALVAGYRFVAQALAYEMPLAIVVITIVLPAESLRLSSIVAAQTGLWYVVWAPVGFAVYLVTAAALAFWGPFATPVASDLAGGVTVELAGADRAVFAYGRYLALASAAAFAVPVFLGGHHGPWLPGWLWIVLKTLAVLALLVASKWLLPRLRIDRFEQFAWAVLIPVTLVQLFVVAGVLLVVR